MDPTQPSLFQRIRARWRAGMAAVGALMPKGLYARSLLIVILPMVLLQSAVAWFFMERHWQLVTRRLSSAVVSDIGAAVDLVEVGASLVAVEAIA